MQPELLRELARLLRCAESDGTNIGFFVAEHAGELAHLLQSDERELRSAAACESDGALVDRLRVRLELAFERERQRRHDDDLERAHRAARELGRTARWFELGVMLDVDLVLGDLLAHTRRRTVRFELPGTPVRVPTLLLRRARPLRRVYMDLASFVDERGIHLRWKAGHGQLNFYAVDADLRASDDDLVVEMPSRRERQPMLIGDILGEMGLGGS